MEMWDTYRHMVVFMLYESETIPNWRMVKSDLPFVLIMSNDSQMIGYPHVKSELFMWTTHHVSIMFKRKPWVCHISCYFTPRSSWYKTAVIVITVHELYTWIHGIEWYDYGFQTLANCGIIHQARIPPKTYPSTVRPHSRGFNPHWRGDNGLIGVQWFSLFAHDSWSVSKSPKHIWKKCTIWATSFWVTMGYNYDIRLKQSIPMTGVD